MKSTDFCYWLQGFFELSNSASIDSKQMETIKNHLHLVFKHEIDPSYGTLNEQMVLSTIHNSGRDQLVRC